MTTRTAKFFKKHAINQTSSKSEMRDECVNATTQFKAATKNRFRFLLRQLNHYLYHSFVRHIMQITVISMISFLLDVEISFIKSEPHVDVDQLSLTTLAGRSQHVVCSSSCNFHEWTFFFLSYETSRVCDWRVCAILIAKHFLSHHNSRVSSQPKISFSQRCSNFSILLCGWVESQWV